MLAQSVSPPHAGICSARRIAPIGGSFMKVLSACQASVPEFLGFDTSITVKPGVSLEVLSKTGILISPKRRAKRRCCSGESG